MTVDGSAGAAVLPVSGAGGIISIISFNSQVLHPVHKGKGVR